MAGGYDSTLTISLPMTNVSQNDILGLSTPDPAHWRALGMDAFDHDLNFEGDNLLDDLNSGLPSLPFTPSYELSDPFSATFEDPFSYQSGNFAALLEDTTQNTNSESTTADLDNKLLGFGAPIIKAAILDDAGQTWPQMSAELYGMFFVAEDVFGSETTGRPMELTCYRRNLFQISGNLTLSRSIKGMLNEAGQHVPIYDTYASISALESIDGRSTEIITVPWKTNAGTSSEDKAGTPPAKLPIDLSMNPELDPTCVSIPIAWKRLQFKHATANNGRRKGLQQHYVIQVNLMASLATGECVKLAEIQSGAIIVRGRSPRNFDSRKDVSLCERKLEPKQRVLSDAAPSLKVDTAVTGGSYKFYTMNSLQQPLDLPDCTNTKTPLQSPNENSLPKPKKTLSSSNFQRRPVPGTKWKTDTTPSKPSQLSVPIDLSLADEEYGRSHSTSLLSSCRTRDVSPLMEKKTLGSPVEDADLLYEYFPLSLDDWMPPVDAIYRPHVVHHTIIPPDLKAAQMKSKTKRYFSADE